ncbi:MAG TPA: XdhC family protein [Stellaceae bacterium]|nr:XdhC family protein [Stellaceae bacterium]
MKGRLLDAVLAAGREARSLVLATELKSGRQLLLDGGRAEGDLALDEAALGAMRAALRADRNRMIEGPDGRVFIQVFSPSRRCFVIGAVHIAQPLVQMLGLADYQAIVVDPRESFATEARFPGLELSTEWPDEALERLKPDHRSAVVTLTHDPKLDDPALAVALRSDCFYIGALGSKRTHAARCGRLKEMGFTDADLARIHGPIGLSIGAVSPAEIAVSILGQITEVLRRGDKEPA